MWSKDFKSLFESITKVLLGLRVSTLYVMISGFIQVKGVSLKQNHWQEMTMKLIGLQELTK